jgi:hypothetical protein
MNIQKTEEKTRFYLSSDPSDLTIPLYKFEQILFKLSKTHHPSKNLYKIYGINDKYMKVFDDGSCFNYCIKKITTMKQYKVILQKIIQQQIHSDDFAGFLKYTVEELYQEIFFTLNESINLVFSKMIDINTKTDKYYIYFEKKKSNSQQTIEQFLDLVDIS